MLHFFGSKAGLFDAALEPPFQPEEVARVVEGPRDSLGARVVSFYVRTVFGEKAATVASLLRSAVTDEAAAARLFRRRRIQHTMNSTAVELSVKPLGSGWHARDRCPC